MLDCTLSTYSIITITVICGNSSQHFLLRQTPSPLLQQSSRLFVTFVTFFNILKITWWRFIWNWEDCLYRLLHLHRIHFPVFNWMSIKFLVEWMNLTKIRINFKKKIYRNDTIILINKSVYILWILLAFNNNYPFPLITRISDWVVSIKNYTRIIKM
jgi:hypothetical protein